MASRKRYILWLSVALILAAVSAWAQNPIANPGFENGLAGWTPYSYSLTPANPVAGCIGVPPCVFNRLNPPPAPDGDKVCGIQSYETTGNGGVCQTFTCPYGPATIRVTARAYSEKYDATPYNNGCLVRMGLVAGATQDRSGVTWVDFPWSADWRSRALLVPQAGTYTLFIEAYQPDSTAIMSTLWDKVEFFAQPPVLVTNSPTIVSDPQHPDTSVTISWTTNTPSTSYVDYGSTSAYGATLGSGSLVTQHNVTLTGLSHSSQYHFRVRSDATGYVGFASDDTTFQTPIWFSNIRTSLSPDGQSTIVEWSTDASATSQVEYWSDVDGHACTPEITALTTSHQVTIAGLASGRLYSFRVWGRNQPDYSDASSDAMTFWTLPQVSSSLANGNFESVSGGQGHDLYPWVQYTTQEGSSGYHPIDGLVGAYPAGGASSWLPSQGTEGPYFPGVQAYDGSYFLGAGANAAYKNGGVFQRVSVNPGDFYTLTVRYITHRSGGEYNYCKVRIGVDPNGGVDPASSSIKWWSGFSESNDNQWRSAAVTVIAGSGGVATVFLEFQQRFPIEWHVGAIDGVTFGTPFPKSIGALKESKGSLGAVLENKTVTYVNATVLSYDGKYYTKAYVEEDNRTAGVAVLLPTSGSDFPEAGNKLTATGALGVYNGEAAFVAESWTVDHNIYDLPAPFAMSQSSLGKAAENQPSVVNGARGACNTGLRVRVFGKVTDFAWGGSQGDMTAYIDDGCGYTDGAKKPDQTLIKGIRTYLLYDYVNFTNVAEGDYIAVTGPLTIEKIDPNGWPGDGNEYYIYSIPVRSSDDWNLLWTPQ